MILVRVKYIYLLVFFDVVYNVIIIYCEICVIHLLLIY